MTEEQIIRALECCKNDDCDNCPNTFGNCYANLAGYALDLINRQQAEIDRLTNYNRCIDAQCRDLLDKEEKAKAEAINEFAEKLKAEIISETAYGCDTNQHSGYYDYSIKIGDIPEYIDNLVKEMVGADNE